MGVVYQELLRDCASAIYHYEQVEEDYASRKPKLYLKMGRCYNRLGRIDKATSSYEKFLNRAPQDEEAPKARKWLAKLKSRPAGIHVQNLEVKPEKVSPKSDFDLFVEFSVWDPSEKTNYVPVTFRYAILEGERVLFNSKSVHITAPNGKRTPRIVHLTASDKRGTYKIQVRLKYRTKMAGETVMFTID